MKPEYKQKQVTVEFTRPANATQYTAGDVIANSATAPTALTFAQCARMKGAAGTIESALLIDSAAESTPLLADLFLFNAAVALQNDNAAFAPTDAEMKTLVGVIPFYRQNSVGDIDGVKPAVNFQTAANIDGNGNRVHQVNDIDLIYQCAGDSTTLYAVLVARNAYTPVSGEVFTLKLGIDRD